MSAVGRQDKEPVCPFCSSNLARPVEMLILAGEWRKAGNCGCGALYLLDETGKGVGELVATGLGVISEKLSRPIAELVADEDYEDAILSYDWRTHRSMGVSTGYMDGFGRLYVIRSKMKP